MLAHMNRVKVQHLEKKCSIAKPFLSDPNCYGSELKCKLFALLLSVTKQFWSKLFIPLQKRPN